MNLIANTVDQHWLSLEFHLADTSLSPGFVRTLLMWNYCLPCVGFALRGSKVTLVADCRWTSLSVQLFKTISRIMHQAVSLYDKLTRRQDCQRESVALPPCYDEGNDISDTAVFEEKLTIIREVLSSEHIETVNESQDDGGRVLCFSCVDYRNGAMQPLEIKVLSDEVIFVASSDIEKEVLEHDPKGLLSHALSTWMLATNDELLWARMAFVEGRPGVVVRWPLRFLDRMACCDAVDAVSYLATTLKDKMESLLNDTVAREYLWRKELNENDHPRQNRKEVKVNDTDEAETDPGA